MKFNTTLLLCTTLYSGVSLPTLAEEADNSTLFDEIVVTAQRKSESINDVGMSIQAFGSDQLKEQRVKSVKDLTSLVPSFTVSHNYQGVPNYTLRGIGFNTINLSATSTVGTYVDEVAYAYPLMNTGPVFDIERVEILKGPQGTLYGRNTTAGLVGFITAKPTKDFEGGAYADLGSYQTYNLEAYVSGPLADGIQGRIAVKSENSDKGWQQSNARPDDRLGKVDRLGVRGALAIQPSDKTSIDLSVNYWQNKSDTLAAQVTGFTPSTDPNGTNPISLFNAPGLVDYVASNLPTKATQADWAPASSRNADIGTGLGFKEDLEEDGRFWGLKLRIDHELTDTIKLVSLTSYNDYMRHSTLDYGGAPFEILILQADGRIKSFAEDFHIEGESGPINWLVGGYYGKDTIYDSNRTLLGENANVPFIRFFAATLLNTPFNTEGYTALEASQAFRSFVDEGDITTEIWSAFANADWSFSEELKLTFGIRYTEDTQNYVGCSRDFNGNFAVSVNTVNRALFLQTYGVLADPIAPNECNTFNPESGAFELGSSVLDENNVSWRAALDWAPNDDLLVFGSVSHGTKSGTTPINPASLARQNAPVTQEQLTAYELGIKATAADGLRLNASAFYYDYKDKQIATFFADPIYTALARLDNIPKSHAYGLEADILWKPLQSLTIAATGLWLHTEVDGYVGTNAGGQPEDFDGAEFTYSPKFQGSITATFEQPVNEDLTIRAILNGRYQTKSNSVFEDLDPFKIDAYDVWNASIGLYQIDNNWSVSFWARNLFNKYYWSGVSQNANTVVRFAGQARTFGLSIGTQF